MRRSLVVAAMSLVMALAAIVPPTWAQSYPTRPIQFVIPFATGGPTDTAIRVIQPQLAANLGAPVILVNKPGGGGAVGMDGVAKAKADGYTLAATVRSTLTILPATQPDVTYKISDFAVIGSYALDSGVILVKAGAPWKTLEEFVDYARKNPGKVTYGSAGLGTNSYFNMELLQQAYGITLSHVPFNGSGPVKNALLGGHVPIGAAALSAVLSVVRSGDLVALATSANKRLSVIATTPTMTEKGQPDASLSTWMELYAPAKTPKPVIDRLSAAVEKTMKDPDVIAAIEKAGLSVEYHDPAAALALVERENEVVVRLAKKLNLGR
jgi:tripartite-type tricarboxylate transporter receptor subunit TctC